MRANLLGNLLYEDQRTSGVGHMGITMADSEEAGMDYSYDSLVPCMSVPVLFT